MKYYFRLINDIYYMFMIVEFWNVLTILYLHSFLPITITLPTPMDKLLFLYLIKWSIKSETETLKLSIISENRDDKKLLE